MWHPVHSDIIHSKVAALKEKDSGYSNAHVAVKNALRQNENRYKTFIALSTEGIWRFELDQPIPTRLNPNKQIDLFYKYAYLAECNDVMAKMYGYKKASEIVGARLNDFLIRSDPANVEYLTAFITSGYSLNNVESHETDKDGKAKYFLNNLVGVLENNHIHRAWGTQRDITKLKETELHLERTLKDFEQIKYALDQSAIVAITDRKGRIEYANDRFIEISKYNRSDLIGKTHRIINSQYHPRDFFRSIWKTIGSGKVWHGEIKNRTKDGKYYWVDTTITPLLGHDGRPERFIAIRFDITRRKELEEQKDDFISIASHELKTPITSIKAFTQILDRKLASHKDKKLTGILDHMNKQVENLTYLVNDLLDVSEIQAGRLLIRKERCDLTGIIKEVVSDVEATISSGTSGNRPRIIVESDKKIEVMADRYRIGQVLNNLLINAVKFSASSKKICIKCGKKGNEIIVSVRDFGIGIPADKLTRIFEKYYSINMKKEKKSVYSSLGLGLHISSEIIKQHGGKIWAKSIEKKGSVFCFSLPLLPKKKIDSLRAK